VSSLHPVKRKIFKEIIKQDREEVKEKEIKK